VNANRVTGADVNTFRTVWGIERFDAMDQYGRFLWGERIT
jgi:hypothetical protein